MFHIVPKRFIFVIMGFTATSLSIFLQTNLTLTIVYMVDRSNETARNTENFSECNAIEELNSNVTFQAEYKQGDFHWDPNTQGVALGAVYYGMLLAYIPGGRFAELFGGKRTILCSLLMASCFTAILPIAAHLSVVAFIICRIVIGIGAAPVFPVLFYMMARWVPIPERSLDSSIILAGYGIGAFVSLLATGFLCSSNIMGGWPSVFYIGGITGVLWCVLFYFFVFETPDEHPTIFPTEAEYIQKNLETVERKQIEKIPWKSIATSIPFWSLAGGVFGQFWIMGFYVTSQALYMGTILQLESAQNGYLSCLPSITRAVFACFGGAVADWALTKKSVSVVYIRKGSTLLNSITACLGFIAILFTGCDPILNTLWFTLGGIMADFVTFGVLLAIADIAPNLTGTLCGVMSSISNIPYFVLPALIGLFTQNERSMAQWNYIYICIISVIVITTVIYLAFGTSEPQLWGTENHDSSSTSNKTEQSVKEKYINVIFEETEKNVI